MAGDAGAGARDDECPDDQESRGRVLSLRPEQSQLSLEELANAI